MAFPYIFESNFEQGTNAEWDSESDTGNQLDFPHYSVLANIPNIGPAAPYRGAYCMRIRLLGVTTLAQLTETDIDIAVNTTRWSSFMLYISPDFLATADDLINIYQLLAVATVEGVIALRITAATDVVEIGIGETAGTAWSAETLTKGQWYHIELAALNDPGANDGTLTLYVNGISRATVSSLDQGVIDSGLLGTINALSTTTGTLLFDMFRFNDLQVFPPKEQYPNVVTLTKDAHVFVGPGWIDSADLLSAAGSIVLYDTDTANTQNEEAVINIDSSLGRTGFEGGAEFKRGCYADLSTNTRAEVRISTGASWPGQYGPKAHWSPGAVRAYGQRRRARAQNV